MQVVETKSESLLKDFRVTLAAADIEARVDSRLAAVGQDARIPGFRPGKAPVGVLKRRFGPAVRGEVLEAALRDSTQQLLAERGLRPASQPKIEVTSYAEGNDLEYDLSVELLPEIGDVDFSTIELERLTVAPTDDEIDQTLARLAEQNRESKKVEDARAAAAGDIVVVDFVGRIDGEAFAGGTGNDIQIDLGAGQFIPGFEDQLIGAKAGEARDVTVTFPDDYGSQELAGKEAVFACQVKELHEPVATEINDDFANRLGLDTLEALKEAIRDQLRGEYAQYARAKVKRELLDKLSEAYDFEVPPLMLDSEFEQIWRQVEEAREKDTLDPEDKGKSEDELRKQYREIAERRVRLGLLLSHVGEVNNLSVTQEEVNRAIMERARQMPGHEQRVIDFYRSNAEAQASLQAPIFEDKVVNFILEMASVSVRDVTPEELRAEMAGEEAGEAGAGEAEDKPAKKKARAKKSTGAKASGAKSAGKSKAKAKASEEKGAE